MLYFIVLRRDVTTPRLLALTHCFGVSSGGGDPRTAGLASRTSEVVRVVGLRTRRNTDRDQRSAAARAVVRSRGTPVGHAQA